MCPGSLKCKETTVSLAVISTVFFSAHFCLSCSYLNVRPWYRIPRGLGFVGSGQLKCKNTNLATI